MPRPVDGQMSLAQIPNVQQMQAAAQREAELAEQRQRLAARRIQEQESERVQRDEAILSKTIRDEDPREDRKPKDRREPPLRNEDQTPVTKVDITL